MGVLATCLSALLLAGLIWYGWLDPVVRADAADHYYPPVTIPLPASPSPANGLHETALRLPTPRPSGTAPDSETAESALLLPDLRIRRPSDLTVVGSRAAGTQRLKFTTVIWNDGDGPVEVRGSQTTTENLRVVQYLHRSIGGPLPGEPVGSFDFEHRHGHLHLEEFASYELWSLDDEDRPVEVVARNAKVGFCLMDNVAIAPGLQAEDGVYTGCEAEVQGISVGYGDVYVAALYEQDLNVSQVADGHYRLVNTVNPAQDIRELSTANNESYVDIVLSAGLVMIRD